VHRIGVEDDWRLFGPALELFGKTIAEASFSKQTGALYLAFEGDRQLDVNPDERFEAWQISGYDRLLVVCTPGGEPAIVWGGEDTPTHQITTD
jgi:hypothetical protein